MWLRTLQSEGGTTYVDAALGEAVGGTAVFDWRENPIQLPAVYPKVVVSLSISTLLKQH